MAAYYNEIDPFCAEWLRNLIGEGLIAPGDVDDRSIKDVRADDLKGYAQCHFFAGIGGWSYALRLAGWPDEKGVWTGSCPCQPLSGAGQRKGHADERHLWPAFYALIAECRPATVFGEQVAGRDGMEWMAAVRSDMEAIESACGIADLPAAGVGAPHGRAGLFWVAHSPRMFGIGRNYHPERSGSGTVALSKSRNGDCAAVGADGDWWNPKSRPFAVAHGVPGSVGTVSAYGNAIVPQVAAEFVKAYAETASRGD